MVVLQKKKSVKGNISDHPFQTPLFPVSWTPIFVCLFRENFSCNNLPLQQFLCKQHIFLERKTILCCLGSIFDGENQFSPVKPVFLVRSHWHFAVLTFKCIFPFRTAKLTFIMYSFVIQVVFMYLISYHWKMNMKFYLEI